MNTIYDFKNNTYEMIQTNSDEIVYTKDEHRLENYTYVNSHGKGLLYVSKVYEKESNELQTSLLEPTEEYVGKVYEKIKDSPFLCKKYSNNVLYEYAPALVYNAYEIKKGIKNKKDIFLVENERFANYLINNGFLATTIYNPSCFKKINLKIFKGANVYIIKFKSFINYEKQLENIARKVRTLEYGMDFQNEFGSNCELLKVVKKYTEYESNLENVDLLYDEDYYNHFNNTTKLDKED